MNVAPCIEYEAFLRAQHEGLTDVVAMDPNPAMFPYARDALAAAYGARTGPRVSFMNGRAEALPVETATADAVVSTLVRVACSTPAALLCAAGRASSRMHV